jgi:hypothetical protein
VVVALDGNTLPELKDTGALTLTFQFGFRPKLNLTFVRGVSRRMVEIDFD